MDLKISVTGVEDIDAVLRGLPAQLNHRVLQAAHADAATPMVNRMHLLAPVGETGKTADSIGIIKTPFAKAAVIGEITVGPRRGRFGGSKAHFSEFGTVPRFYRGASRGQMRIRKFVEPAFNQTNQTVLNRIAVSLGTKTYQFMKRTIRNG